LTLLNQVQRYTNINMKDKVKALLGSIRFWIVTLTAIVAILEGWGDMATVLDIVKMWLLTVAGIGTVDSVAKNLSGSK